MDHCNKYPLLGEKFISFNKFVNAIKSKLIVCVVLSYRYERALYCFFGNTKYTPIFSYC
jgi:hypothetical protein